MMIPEPTEFPKAPLANFSSAVNQFGTTTAKAYAALDNLNCVVLSNIGKSDVIVEPYYDATTVCSSHPEPIQELHNCNNCGGTVDEEGYCRYCGSRVYFFGEHKPKFHNKFDVGF